MRALHDVRVRITSTIRKAPRTEAAGAGRTLNGEASFEVNKNGFAARALQIDDVLRNVPTRGKHFALLLVHLRKFLQFELQPLVRITRKLFLQ